jgi:hypothetical protein
MSIAQVDKPAAAVSTANFLTDASIRGAGGMAGGVGDLPDAPLGADCGIGSVLAIKVLLW